MTKRFFPFREGDRTEYLANYLLSGIGLVTAVPRQEDTGIDFYCQLVDNETVILTFGYPFLIQIKSNFKPILFGSKKPDKWTQININWLFRLELPFFIGVVEKKTMCLSIYNTSTLNFIFYENPNASLIELNLSEGLQTDFVGRPEQKKINDWPSEKGDGYLYEVKLGCPLITISNEDIYNENILKEKKKILRSVIAEEMTNLLFRKLNLMHFKWVARFKVNNPNILFGWIYETIGKTDENIEKMFKSSGPILIALAYNFKEANDINMLNILKPLIDRIPDNLKYEELREHIPELFSQS
jgi:hypothetical protein